MKSDCRFSPRLLWEYEEGLLDERRRADVERHLSACASCRERANGDRELFAKLREQRPLAAPETARPPKWETMQPATPATRWRWAVTVAGVAVLAFVALGVFRLAEDRSPLAAGIAMEKDAAQQLQEKAYVAPVPTDQSSSTESLAADVETPVQGSAQPLRKLERADRPAQPDLPPKVSLRREEEVLQPKATLRVEAGERSETRPSPPGTKVTPPKAELGGAGVGGGPRDGVGAGLGAAADELSTQAVVTALTDDGKVLAVAQLDAPNRVSIREQDGTTLSIELGSERRWSSRPSYLDRLISLRETGPLSLLSAAISCQASVPIEVKDAAQNQVVRVQLSEVQLGLALANIALATETEWKAEKDRIVISPLLAHAASGKTARGVQEQAPRLGFLAQQMREGNLIQRKSSDTLTACPWCGRPHLGPLWRYCPFCGQPLEGKP